jgi:hypothetical protein
MLEKEAQVRRELAEQPSIHSLVTARSETNAEEIRRAEEVRWRLKNEKDSRMRREEKRRVCVSGPCEEGFFIGSRRGPQALFPTVR